MYVGRRFGRSAGGPTVADLKLTSRLWWCWWMAARSSAPLGIFRQHHQGPDLLLPHPRRSPFVSAASSVCKVPQLLDNRSCCSVHIGVKEIHKRFIPRRINDRFTDFEHYTLRWPGESWADQGVCGSDEDANRKSGTTLISSRMYPTNTGRRNESLESVHISQITKRFLPETKSVSK